MDYSPQIHFPFEIIYDANSIASNGMETDRSKYKTPLSSSTIFNTALSFEWRPLYVWGLEQLPYCFLSEKVFTFDQTQYVFRTFLCPFMGVCLPVNVNDHFQVLRNKENIHSTTISVSSLLYMIFFLKIDHWRLGYNHRSFVKMVRKEGMGIFTCR